MQSRIFFIDHLLAIFHWLIGCLCTCCIRTNPITCAYRYCRTCQSNFDSCNHHVHTGLGLLDVLVPMFEKQSQATRLKQWRLVRVKR